MLQDEEYNIRIHVCRLNREKVVVLQEIDEQRNSKKKTKINVVPVRDKWDTGEYRFVVPVVTVKYRQGSARNS